MKKRVLVMLWLFVIVFCAGYGAARLLMQDNAIALSATYNERLSNSSGQISEHRYIVARAPDRSVRINLSAKPDGTECRVRIVRTSSSTTLVVDDLQAKSTIYHPLPQPSSDSFVASKSRYKINGAAKCFGFDADIMVAEDKASKVERWIIPQLSNLVAKDLRYWKDSTGAVVSSTEQTLMDLVVAPPDPTLFVVPATYAEMTPSQIQAALFRDILQLPATRWNLDVFRKGDEIYSSSQIYKR